MSLIFPPLSHSTPLASLSGWTLVLKCPKCGDRAKPLTDLIAAVRLSRPIGDIISRLACDTCRSKPERLTGVCTWITDFGREPVSEDWSFLLEAEQEKA